MEKFDPETAISSAYDQYADAIFRHIAYRLGDRERGKDLMQDTFIRTFEYLKKGTPAQNIRALLYRIANNLIIDEVRRKTSSSLDALQEAGFDPSGSGESEILDALSMADVMTVLLKMPEASRDLIVMRFIDDMKPREIAEMLGLPANTVSVRIHRAMDELKSLLHEV
jgi:RNA polymerase sigma-70 factor (ECF subfamily)